MEKGDLVKHRDQYGIIIDWYDQISSMPEMGKVYFFEEDCHKILDEHVLEKAEDSDFTHLEYYLLKFCNCGEKHCEKPTSHSDWCKVEEIRRSKLSDKIKSSS